MRKVASVLFVLALGSFTALAEEILILTDGRSMAIRSHEVDGNMIKVDLGGNGFMAFPMEKVERIENAGKNVFLSPSGQANKIIETKIDPAGSHPVTGRRPSRYVRAEAAMPTPPDPEEDQPIQGRIETEGGMAVHRPFAGSEHAGKRKLGNVGGGVIWGASPVQPGQPLSGTRPLGNKHVIGSAVPPGMKVSVPVTGFGRREDAVPGSGDSGGQNDDAAENDPDE